MEPAKQPQMETEPALPRANPELVGHEAIERALVSDISSGRLPHALILAGPEGVGKTTLAFRLAKYLLSEHESTGGLFGDEPSATDLSVDPQSPVARRVSSGGHADVLTIECGFDEKKGKKSSHVSVDDVRRIAPFLRKTSAEGGWRIVIVNEAETMKSPAQNAVLKILEEPPAKTLLILITNQPGAFLPTIRSRCRLVTLSPLSESQIIALLRRKAPSLNENDLKSLARLSDGSIGKALHLYHEGGLDMYHMLLDVLETLPRINYIQLNELSEKLAAKGKEESYKMFMELLLWWLSRMVRALGRGQAPEPVIPEEQEALARLSGVYSQARWLELWDHAQSVILETEYASLDKKQAALRIFREFEQPL